MFAMVNTNNHSSDSSEGPPTFAEMRSAPGGQDVDEDGGVRALPLLSGSVQSSGVAVGQLVVHALGAPGLRDAQHDTINTRTRVRRHRPPPLGLNIPLFGDMDVSIILLPLQSLCPSFRSVSQNKLHKIGVVMHYELLRVIIGKSQSMIIRRKYQQATKIIKYKTNYMQYKHMNIQLIKYIILDFIFGFIVRPQPLKD